MGDDRTGTHQPPPQQRLSVAQAAEAMGISAEAVRSRIKRGTIESVKVGGTVYAILEPGLADQTTAQSQSDAGDITSELRAHLATLREQLDAERQAHAEARRIIAGLVEHLPITNEPPQGAETPQTVAVGRKGGHHPKQPLRGRGTVGSSAARNEE